MHSDSRGSAAFAEESSSSNDESTVETSSSESDDPSPHEQDGGGKDDGGDLTERVLICDVHAAVQLALEQRIESAEGLTVAGKTANARELPDLIEETGTTTVVLELAHQNQYALSLIQDLKKRFPELNIVIYSMYAPLMYAERAIRAGAAGYVRKTEPTERVVDAIRTTAAGDVYLERPVASDVLRKIMGEKSGSVTDVLTDRELAVVQLIGEQLDTKDIAEMLGLNLKTVETYRRRARKKLHFKTKQELIIFALEQHHV